MAGTAATTSPPALDALVAAGFEVWAHHGSGTIPDAARDAATALFRSLARQLAEHALPVTVIAPNYLVSQTYDPPATYIDDPAGRDVVTRTVPVGRLGRPEEIGELIAYLATMEGAFLTGSVIDFSGGWPVATPGPEHRSPDSGSSAGVGTEESAP